MRALFAAVIVCVAAAPVLAAVEDDLRDGDKYFEEGDWRKAATAYDRAISKGPTEVPAAAYGKRAAIYIILKDYKGGLAFIDQAKTRYEAAFRRNRHRLTHRLDNASVATGAIEAVDAVWESLLTRALERAD